MSQTNESRALVVAADTTEGVCTNCHTPLARLQSLMDAAEVVTGSAAPFERTRARRALTRVIASCPVCATRVATWREADQAVRALYVADVPPARVYLDALHAVAARASSAPKSRRALALRPALAAGFAVVAAVVLAVVVLRTPGAPLNPTVSWAQVEQAMATTVKTARWVERSESFDETGARDTYRVEDKYAQLDPPMQASIMRARETLSGFPRRPPLPGQGKIRINISNSVETGQYRDVYDSVYNKVTRTHLRQDAPANVPGGRAGFLRIRILNSIAAPPEATGGAGPTGWTSEKTALNGKPVLRFVFRYEPFNKRRSVRTVWADEATRRIVRAERRQFFPQTDRVNYLDITEDFTYNEPLPSSVFTVKTPASAPAAKRIEEDEAFARPLVLTPAERAEAERLIERSEDGWRRADFAAFARAWDFGYLTRSVTDSKQDSAERRRQWKIRVENQKGNFREWRSSITGVQAQNFIMGGVALRHGEPGVWLVNVRTRGRWRDTNETLGGDAAYMLNRNPATGALRIVHWEYAALWRGLHAHFNAHPRSVTPP